MAILETLMGLRYWDQLTDKFDHAILALNFQKIAAHDHTSGRGNQFPTGGIVDLAVTNPKIAESSIGVSKLTPAAIAAIQSAAIPIGTILPYSGPGAPAGYLLCDGSQASRTQYQSLWDLYRNGTSNSPYGNGNGTTTFNIPDLRGRVPTGVDLGAGRLTANNAQGQSGGEEKHILTITEMPSHNHGGATSPTSQVGPINAVADYVMEYHSQTGYSATDGFASSNHQHSISAQGGGAAHNNTQPYLNVNYVVKYS